MRGAEEDWSQKAVIYQRMGRRFRAAYRHKMVCHITGSWATQPLCQGSARELCVGCREGEGWVLLTFSQG